MRALLGLALLAACTDDPTPGVLIEPPAELDAARPDSAQPDAANLDAARPDARRDATPPTDMPRADMPIDSGLPDQARMDAGRDIGLDATPVDQSVDMDLDAAPDAALDQQVDMQLDLAIDMTPAPDMASDALVDAGFVWPPAECEGVVIPPVPDSPDGSEVCNYRDDDGDGLVDEGHGYVNLGFTMAVPDEFINVSSSGWTMIATPESHVVAWYDSFGIHMTVLDERGCPLTGDHLVSTNPNEFALGRMGPRLAYNAGRVALVYSERRLRPDGRNGPFSTFLQLITPRGELLGQPIDLTPNRVGQSSHAVLPFEDDQFAIFASTANPVEPGFQYGELIIVDRDGQQVGERLTPFDGQRAVGGEFNTMAYGDGHFALAWQGGFGTIAIFDRMGRMRALEAIEERIYDRAIVWTGSYFATTLIWADNVLPLFDLDGQQPDWSPLNPSNDPEPRVGRLMELQRGFLAVHSLYEPRNVRRLDLIWRLNERGESIAPPTSASNLLTAIDVSPTGGISDLRVILGQPGLQLMLSGCAAAPGD